MRATSCREAIKNWEEKNGVAPAEATEVSLIGQSPPMDKIDDSLNQFENCVKLSLSTNAIDRMISLPRLKNLKILSMGRNNIRRLQYLDDIAGSLEELWLSYNNINSLDGIQACQKLHTIYLSNNKIAQWKEVKKCEALPELRSVLFFGNPVYDATSKQINWPMVVHLLPQVETVDGVIVTGDVKEAAKAIED